MKNNPEYKDEHKVVELIQARLAKGFQDYGSLDLDNDNRDFNQEAVEEVLDMAVYLACKLIKLQRKEETMTMTNTTETSDQEYQQIKDKMKEHLRKKALRERARKEAREELEHEAQDAK